MSNVYALRPEQHPAASMNNLEAEQVLLSSVLISETIADELLMTVDPTDFYEPLHGRMWQMMRHLRAADRNANPVSLWSMMGDDPALLQVGGARYLADLSGSVVSVVAHREAAQDVVEMARRRRLAMAATRALDALSTYDDTTAPATLESALADYVAPGDESAAVDAAAVAERVMARIATIRERGGPSGWTVPNIPDWNGLTGGMEPGQMIVIGARPGMGKTAVACSLALGAAAAGHGVLLVSLEMGADELGVRMVSDLCHTQRDQVPYLGIKDAELTVHEHDRVTRAAARLAELPLQIAYLPGVTPARLASTVRRHKRRMALKGVSLDLVIVDYLQLMAADTQRRSDYEKVSEISRLLKAMAGTEGVTLIANCQLSREVERRDDKTPRLSDLRDSGAIEQDADKVIFLHRLAYYLEQTESKDPMREAERLDLIERVRCNLDLICAKNRQGRTGRRVIFYNPTTQAVRGSDYVR